MNPLELSTLLLQEEPTDLQHFNGQIIIHLNKYIKSSQIQQRGEFRKGQEASRWKQQREFGDLELEICVFAEESFSQTGVGLIHLFATEPPIHEPRQWGL